MLIYSGAKDTVQLHTCAKVGWRCCAAGVFMSIEKGNGGKPAGLPYRPRACVTSRFLAGWKPGCFQFKKSFPKPPLPPKCDKKRGRGEILCLSDLGIILHPKSNTQVSWPEVNFRSLFNLKLHFIILRINKFKRGAGNPCRHPATPCCKAT